MGLGHLVGCVLLPRITGPRHHAEVCSDEVDVGRSVIDDEDGPLIDETLKRRLDLSA